MEMISTSRTRKLHGDDSSLPPQAILYRVVHRPNGEWVLYGSQFPCILAGGACTEQVVLEIAEKTVYAGTGQTVRWQVSSVGDERVYLAVAAEPDRSADVDESPGLAVTTTRGIRRILSAVRPSR